MAENSVILSVEEEAKLLQPIDEYVCKIQDQIDALRVDGTDQGNNISNCIAIAKENKNLSKEEQAKLIAEYKQELEKAKSVENANKQEVTRLIAEAESYLAKHYNSEYYDIVAKSCEAEKKAENSNYDKLKQDLQLRSFVMTRLICLRSMALNILCKSGRSILRPVKPSS